MSSASSSPSVIHSAQLAWNDAGTPISSTFDDVYFSNDNGLDETRYVFLTQNGLPERLSQHDRDLFVIAETGFGTGLNFLAIWQAFRQHLKDDATGAKRLHFISFEKFPLTHADLQQALTHWPELAELSAELLRHYPHLVPGCHRLLLDDGRVTLDLWLGDIQHTLPHVWCDENTGLVDAWFLDGFAPSKNPEMWTEQLFSGLARLARDHATLATFTCAGFVRRGLIAAGFAMQKVKGHGNKREMLRGARLARTFDAIKVPPHVVKPQETITIIGGGMASAALALCLTRRGRRVELLCADATLAQAASGNRQGALYPLLNADHDRLSRFYAPAFGFARRFYTQLVNRQPVAHAWCGVLQFASDERSQKKLRRLSAADFPAELVHALSAGERDHHAGLPLGNAWNADAAVLYPEGGWLAPAELTRAMWREAQQSGLATLQTMCRVTAIEPNDATWQLTLADQPTRQARHLVVATGATLTDLLPADTPLPIYPVRGQVSHLRSNETLQHLACVLCSDGYLTPAAPDGSHCLGASYGRNDTELALRSNEHEDNLQRLRSSLPNQPWVARLTAATDGRVGLRAATRDHLPVVGALTTDDQPASLWLFGALGSRGLCSAPLLADYLASSLCGEPLPLEPELRVALHPTRFARHKVRAEHAS